MYCSQKPQKINPEVAHRVIISSGSLHSTKGKERKGHRDVCVYKLYEIKPKTPHTSNIKTLKMSHTPPSSIFTLLGKLPLVFLGVFKHGSQFEIEYIY